MAEVSNQDHSAESPLDVDLWEATRAAVHAAATAADEHLALGGYRPRVRMATVGAFESGWPNLTGATPILPPDDAPTDYSDLFGLERSHLNPIAFEDVPELAALVTLVRGRDDLMARIGPPGGNVNDIGRRMIDYMIADLPLSLLDRARATDATTDAALLHLYRQRERAWLLDPLPVEYVIPLALTALDLESALVVDSTTKIEPLDTASQAARAPSMYSLSAVPDPVVSAATHAIVLSSHEIQNPGPTQRFFGRDNKPVPLADADLVCEGLRIVTTNRVGYAQVLLRPVGWADSWVHDLPPLQQVMTIRKYPEQFDNFAWLRPPDAIARQVLETLPSIVTSLRAAPPHIRLAARRLSLAALRDTDDDRTVDACIGIEALLGQGRDELSHRIALRAATALATRPDRPADPQAIYAAMRNVYNHRSAVVHGTPGDKSRTIKLGGRTFPAGTVAVILLREILQDILTRTGGWTTAILDSTLLASLRPTTKPDEGAGSVE